jgi:hypothetical protein
MNNPLTSSVILLLTAMIICFEGILVMYIPPINSAERSYTAFSRGIIKEREIDPEGRFPLIVLYQGQPKGESQAWDSAVWPAWGQCRFLFWNRFFFADFLKFYPWDFPQIKEICKKLLSHIT